MDDESPDVGLDEIVGERPADLFSTRTWQLPKYERRRTEIADRTDEPQTKVVRSCCGFPYVMRCKYRSKTWVALEYVGVTRERFATRGGAI